MFNGYPPNAQLNELNKLTLSTIYINTGIQSPVINITQNVFLT